MQHSSGPTSRRSTDVITESVVFKYEEIAADFSRTNHNDMMRDQRVGDCRTGRGFNLGDGQRDDASNAAARGYGETPDARRHRE